MQGGGGQNSRAPVSRSGRAVEPPAPPAWRKWMQAFLPAAPYHPSAIVSLTGLALAFFWRTSPDTIARRRDQLPAAQHGGGKKKRKKGQRRASQLPDLAEKDDTAYIGLDSISVDEFCEQAEEELVARAAEVATEVRLLQNELRQVRLKTRQLRLVQPQKVKEKVSKDRLRRHETLTDTLWNSLDAAKHGLDPFIRAHESAMETRKLEQKVKAARGNDRRTDMSALNRATSLDSGGGQGVDLNRATSQGASAIGLQRRTSLHTLERRLSSLANGIGQTFQPMGNWLQGAAGAGGGREKTPSDGRRTDASDERKFDEYGNVIPGLQEMGGDSAFELQKLGIAPAPWTQFVPVSGATERVTYAAFAAFALLILFYAFLSIEGQGDAFASIDNERLPLSMIICRPRSMKWSHWVVLALAVLTLPICAVLFVRAFKQNVNWPAIIFLLYSASVWLTLTLTMIRTVLLIAAYSQEAPPLPTPTANMSCYDQNMLAQGNLFQGYNTEVCLATTTFVGVVHLLLLIAYMLTDLLKAKGPRLRLWLGCILALEMYKEVHARSGDVLLPQEQNVPTGFTLFDEAFGGRDATTQTFVLNIDRSVFMLMLTGFFSTVLRPEACAFILLPCRDSNALFFCRQDRRTRRLLGTRRYERLSLWLQLKRNQWKRTWRQWRRSCCRKACCGKSSVFNLSPSGVDESGRMSGSDRESRRASPTRRHDVKAVAATAVEVAEVL